MVGLSISIFLLFSTTVSSWQCWYKLQECKNRGRYQASSLPRPKQSVLPKVKLSSTFRSSSNSRISTPRAPLFRQRAATPDTSKMFPNCENWERGAMKLHESSMLQSQEAIKNKSARVHPFNYRNTEEKVCLWDWISWNTVFGPWTSTVGPSDFRCLVFFFQDIEWFLTFRPHCLS